MSRQSEHHPTPEERSRLQHAAEHERPDKSRSVLLYLMILFAAAFLLMALSYLMQRRSSDQTIQDLRQSVSSMQSVADIQQENQQLRQQLEELETQLNEAEQQLQGLQGDLQTSAAREEKLIQALDLFWQIDEAYVRGRYSLCRELIARMEDASSGGALKEYLPRESTTDNERFSPYDRYEEIYGLVT